MNEVSLRNSELGEYVHDALEMESTRYTVQVTVEKLKSDVESVKRKKAQGITPKPYLPVTDEKQLLPYEGKPEYHFDATGPVFGTCLRLSIPIMIILGIIIIISSLISENKQWVLGVVCLYISPLPGLLIASSIHTHRKKRCQEAYWSKVHAIDARNKKVEEKNRQIASYNKKRRAEIWEKNALIRNENEARLKKHCDECDRIIAEMNASIDEIAKVEDNMDQQITRFYSKGMIPKDYRSLDCVFVFDQIFRNDLADTMREAVILYEERKFRGEVIQGMGSIIAQLSSLNGRMYNIEQAVNRIQTEAEYMSQDLFRICEQNKQAADEAARQHAEVMKQSEMQQYLDRSIAENVERLNRYFTDN